MKVWVVEIHEYDWDFSDTNVDSVWTSEDKAKERTDALKKMDEHLEKIHGLSLDYYYYGIELNKEEAEHEEPDGEDD